jgi:hypothetical protein
MIGRWGDREIRRWGEREIVRTDGVIERKEDTEIERLGEIATLDTYSNGRLHYEDGLQDCESGSERRCGYSGFE